MFVLSVQLRSDEVWLRKGVCWFFARVFLLFCLRTCGKLPIACPPQKLTNMDPAAVPTGLIGLVTLVNFLGRLCSVDSAAAAAAEICDEFEFDDFQPIVPTICLFCVKPSMIHPE